MITAILPGSFDPVTYGHIDIIERASAIVDELWVLVVYNSLKKTMFTFEERVEHIEFLTSRFENVKASSWSGLTAEYAKKEGAKVIFRGLRNGADFDYEGQIACVNKEIAPGIETVFLKTTPELSYISSTVVKEIFSYGGNIDGMVHQYIKDKMNMKKTHI